MYAIRSYYEPPGAGPARRLDLPADVGRHRVGPALRPGFAQQDLVEREGLGDLRVGNAADRVAHVVQHVVAGAHGLVDHVEPDLAAHAPEVHRGDQALDLRNNFV